MVSLKRKHSESLNIIPAAPLTPESQHENGVGGSNSISRASEQESWELSHSLLANTEMAELSADNQTELGQLVRARYPGYGEDLRARWEEDQEECEGDGLSDWDTDSECETERTEDSHWPGLTGLAQQATALATTTQQPVISDVASSELDWLLTLQKHNLPALLLSQNKRTVTSLLSATASLCTARTNSTGVLAAPRCPAGGQQDEYTKKK